MVGRGCLGECWRPADPANIAAISNDYAGAVSVVASRFIVVWVKQGSQG